jgi:hypothetical protein
MLALELGLVSPSQLASSVTAQSQGTFDADAYLAANPDVVESYQSAVQEYGVSSPQDWAWLHYQKYGKGEGRTFNYKAGTGTDSQFADTGYTSSLYGKLANIPSFSYNDFDFNLSDAMNQYDTGGKILNLATDKIAAQKAASGGFGSGNQATALSDYIAGTYEPTLYSQAANTYNTNYQNAYNTYLANLQSQYELPYQMLTGTAGTGLSAAGADAGYSQSGTNALNNYLTSAAGASASGTTSSTNALTALLNSLGGNSGMGGLYLNYLNGENLLGGLTGW